MKAEPLYKRIEEVISELYGYFCRSPKRAEGLRLFQIMAHCPVLRIKRLHDVRWLSIFSCIETLLLTYPAVLDFLKSEETVSAQFLYTQLSNPVVFIGLFALFPVLSVVNTLTKKLQYENISFDSFESDLKSTKRFLLSHTVGDLQLGECYEEISKVMLVVDNRVVFHDHDVGSVDDVTAAKESVSASVHKLCGLVLEDMTTLI